MSGINNQIESSASEPLTAFGDLRTIELSPVVAGSFEYTVSNTELLTNTVAGTGSVTQAEGMAVLSTGASAGGSAMSYSKKKQN